MRNLTRPANRARLRGIGRTHINNLDALTPASMLDSTLLIGKIPTRRTMLRRNPRQILHHQHINAVSRQMPHDLFGYQQSQFSPQSTNRSTNGRMNDAHQLNQTIIKKPLTIANAIWNLDIFKLDIISEMQQFLIALFFFIQIRRFLKQAISLIIDELRLTASIVLGDDTLILIHNRHCVCLDATEVDTGIDFLIVACLMTTNFRIFLDREIKQDIVIDQPDSRQIELLNMLPENILRKQKHELQIPIPAFKSKHKKRRIGSMRKNRHGIIDGTEINLIGISRLLLPIIGVFKVRFVCRYRIELNETLNTAGDFIRFRIIAHIRNDFMTPSSTDWGDIAFLFIIVNQYFIQFFFVIID